jgi:hypothetical protein
VLWDIFNSQHLGERNLKDFFGKESLLDGGGGNRSSCWEYVPFISYTLNLHICMLVVMLVLSFTTIHC